MDKEIIYKYFRGESSDQETDALNEWLGADEANRREFEVAHELYNAVLLTAAREKETVRRRISVWRIAARIAAGAAAVVLLLVGGYRLSVSHFLHDWSQRTTTLVVPTGQRISMTLEDGTNVWLNAGTRFEYPLVFAGRERRVKVQGEALFEVQHDAAHPFVVETYACNVEVLGTKFNVEADQAHDRFSTALIHGSVRVYDRRTNESLVLEPDQKATLVDGHLCREQIANHDVYRWPEGIVSLTGCTFPELMERFEKAFGVRIEIRRSELPALDFNWGKLRVSSGIDHALRMVQRSVDFTYEKNEDESVIYIL